MFEDGRQSKALEGSLLDLVDILDRFNPVNVTESVDASIEFKAHYIEYSKLMDKYDTPLNPDVVDMYSRLEALEAAKAENL